MKITAKISTASNSICMIPLGINQAEKIIANIGKRVICRINGHNLHSAIIQNKELGYHIMVGKNSLDKIQSKLGDDIQIQFSKDTTNYQIDVCEEFLEVLYSDSDAHSIFESLLPGKKRSLIYYTNKAKRSETRINRALKIMEKIKLGYRDLNKITR